jgi:hypothetical protein
VKSLKKSSGSDANQISKRIGYLKCTLIVPTSKRVSSKAIDMPATRDNKFSDQQFMILMRRLSCSGKRSVLNDRFSEIDG